MSNPRYAELLKRPEWKAKSLEIKKRDKRKCTKCGNTTKLNVHHLKYGDGMPWEVPNEWLITLCEGCHREVHGLPEKKTRKPRVRANTAKEIKELKEKVFELEKRIKNLEECLKKLS